MEFSTGNEAAEKSVPTPLPSIRGNSVSIGPATSQGKRPVDPIPMKATAPMTPVTITRSRKGNSEKFYVEFRI